MFKRGHFGKGVNKAKWLIYRENKGLQTCHEASPQAIKMNTSLETEMKENYETRSFSGASC